ncbi:MAG: O-antigen polymerase [Gracilimonas sp.]|nr:O-antigen polymerase [Gracilimonas sp.]
MVLRSFYKYLPLYVFLGIWGLVFFFYNLKLFNIYTASASTIYLILFGIIAFALGYVIFTIFDVNGLKVAENNISERLNPSAIAWLVLGLSITTILGASLIVFTVSMELGGADAYFDTPIRVRNLFTGYQNNPLTPPPLSFKIGNYLINTGFAGTIFGGVLFSLDHKFRIFGILIIPAFIFASTVSIGRYTLVNSLFFFIFAYIISTYYLKPKLRKKRLAEILTYSAAFIFFLGFFTYILLEFRTTLGTENAVKEYALKSSYLYLTGGITALDNFLHQDFSLVYGQSSFRSIFRWLIQLGMWDEGNLKAVHEPFTFVTPAISINTYTYIKSFFEDFGISGVLIFSFVFGALCKLTNQAALNKFSFIRLGIAITLIFAALMSFYSFYFHSITTVIFRLLIIWLIQILTSKYLYNK